MDATWPSSADIALDGGWDRPGRDRRVRSGHPKGDIVGVTLLPDVRTRAPAGIRAACGDGLAPCSANSAERHSAAFAKERLELAAVDALSAGSLLAWATALLHQGSVVAGTWRTTRRVVGVPLCFGAWSSRCLLQPSRDRHRPQRSCKVGFLCFLA